MTLTKQSNISATPDDESVETGQTAAMAGLTANTGLTARLAGQTASPGLRKFLSLKNRNLLEFSNQ